MAKTTANSQAIDTVEFLPFFQSKIHPNHSKSMLVKYREVPFFIGEAPLFVALSDPFRNGHCSRLTFGHVGQLHAKLLHLSAGFGSFISRGKGFHPEKL
jgi:hypothetical protein